MSDFKIGDRVWYTPDGGNPLKDAVFTIQNLFELYGSLHAQLGSMMASVDVSTLTHVTE